MFQTRKRKDNNSSNLIYTKKIDRNKVRLIINFNNFVIEDKVTYQVIYNSIIRKLYNFNIIVIKIFKTKFKSNTI